MSVEIQFDRRLKAVEDAVLELQKVVSKPILQKKSWIEQISGCFKDDPEFIEVVKVGRVICNSDQVDEEVGA